MVVVAVLVVPVSSYWSWVVVVVIESSCMVAIVVVTKFAVWGPMLA